MKELKEKIAKELESVLKEKGVNGHACHTVKNNIDEWGITIEGNTVGKSSKSSMSPIYRITNDIVEIILQETNITKRAATLNKIAENIITFNKENKPDDNMLKVRTRLDRYLNDPEEAKLHLNMQLIGKKNNEGLLKNLVHVDINEDLCGIFYLDLNDENDDEITCSVKITHALEKTLDTNAEEMYKIAMEKNFPRLINLSAVTGVDESELPPGMPEQIIVTTFRMKFGATAILHENTEKMLKARLKSDRILCLPSSVHDWICTAYPEDETELNELRQMVYDINRTSVQPADRLSDDIYELADGKLKQIA